MWRGSVSLLHYRTAGRPRTKASPLAPICPGVRSGRHQGTIPIVPKLRNRGTQPWLRFVSHSTDKRYIRGIPQLRCPFVTKAEPVLFY